jgi:hypothetical protein
MDLDVDSDDSVSSNISDVLLYGGYEDPDIIVTLGTVAAKIALHNFEWRFVTLVMYNTMLHIGVESFLKYYDKTVVLKLGKFVPRHRIHIPQFVLFGQETGEIIETLEWLLNAKYDNTGMYVLICTSSSYEKCNENEMFQFLSIHYFVNSIFLKGSKDGNDMCFKNLYPEKLNNLHGCPLVISTIIQPPFMYLNRSTGKPSGCDGDVIRMVAKILNASLFVTEATEYGHYENNNWTGSLGEIFNKRAHASMCSSPVTPQIYGNFQISITYNSIDMVWAARLPMLKPSWEKIFYPLKTDTRVALFFMFIAIIWINMCLKTKFWRKIRTALDIAPLNVSLFFNTWVIFLGIPVNKLPSKTALRVITVYWLWSCHIIRTAYQAALVSSMKMQLYEDYMVNFNDDINIMYPFGGVRSLRSYYSDEPRIFSNWVVVKLFDSYDVLDSILNGSSEFVIGLNKEFIVHHLMKYNGTKRLQILPEKIVNSPSVMNFKKFNPFKSPINRVLSIMMECGFIDTLYARYLDRGKKFFQHENTEGFEAFTLADVSSCFYILMLGWFLSSIYFLTEIVCKKFERPEPFTFTY